MTPTKLISRKRQGAMRERRARRNRQESARRARLPLDRRHHGRDRRLRRFGAARRRTPGRRGPRDRVHGGLQAIGGAFSKAPTQTPLATRSFDASRDDQHRGQARHRPRGGRDVRGRRRHHHQWRHDDLPDVGFPARHAAQDPDQFLSAGGVPDPRDAEPRRAARRRGLSRAEADRLAVRRRRDPALFRPPACS